jgi:hypothetical protein
MHVTMQSACLLYHDKAIKMASFMRQGHEHSVASPARKA